MSNLPTTSFKVIAILAILWNVFGVFSFIANSFIPEAAFAGLTEDQIAYMNNTPWWSHIIFGTAVTTGLLGSIGLIMRKKWCVILLLISLIAVLINQLYPLLFTEFYALFGEASTLPLPMMIIIVSILLYLYSNRADRRGWLG